MKSIVFDIAQNGLCLMNVDVITHEEFSDTQGTGVSVVAMIDTGATNCFISRKLSDALQLKTHQIEVQVRRFGKDDNTKDYTGVYIGIQNLSTDVFGYHVVIENGMEQAGWDIILGSDFLKDYKFERDGKNGRFTLSITEVEN